MARLDMAIGNVRHTRKNRVAGRFRVEGNVRVRDKVTKLGPRLRPSLVQWNCLNGSGFHIFNPMPP